MIVGNLCALSGNTFASGLEILSAYLARALKCNEIACIAALHWIPPSQLAPFSRLLLHRQPERDAPSTNLPTFVLHDLLDVTWLPCVYVKLWQEP